MLNHFLRGNAHGVKYKKKEMPAQGGHKTNEVYPRSSDNEIQKPRHDRANGSLGQMVVRRGRETELITIIANTAFLQQSLALHLHHSQFRCSIFFLVHFHHFLH